MRNSEESLLKLKKAKFLEAVEISARSLKIVKPKVMFWEKDCHHYSGKEKAHIHTDTRIICISEMDLRKMDFDDIEECASHEVTHLTDTQPETEDIHSDDFYNRHDKTKMFNWRPPGGVSVTTESSNSKKFSKTSRNPNYSMEYCNNCSKKIELSKCSYCGKYYCDDCINAIEPGSYIGNDSKLFINQIKKDEFRYHPCPDYVDYLAQQRKIQSIRYGEALDELTGRRPKYKRVYEIRLPDEDLREQEGIGKKDLTDDEARQKLEDYKRQIRKIVNKNKTAYRRDIPVKERPEYKDTVIIKKNIFEKLTDLKNYIKSIFVKKH